MNILILHASPRPKGVTSTILNEIQSAMAPSHKVESVRIQGLNVKPCIGCMKCRPDKPCVLPHDDGHALAEKFKWADLVILGCPVYWGNMPGTLKLFFDRNVSLFEYCENKAVRCFPRPRLTGKRAALVVSCIAPFPFNLLRSQSRGTIGALKTILKAGGIKIDWIMNVSDACNFEAKKESYLRQARRRGAAI